MYYTPVIVSYELFECRNSSAFVDESALSCVYTQIYKHMSWVILKPALLSSLPLSYQRKKAEQAYIPIEKIIRTSKQSASTSWQCKTSGKHHQPATYGDLVLKRVKEIILLPKCTGEYLNSSARDMVICYGQSFCTLVTKQLLGNVFKTFQNAPLEMLAIQNPVCDTFVAKCKF